MKRIIITAALLLFGAHAVADTVTVTVNANGTTVYSSPIVASGWIDRIEIFRADPETSDVVDVDIATFRGTTALMTFADVDALATNGTQVLRPRFLGTGDTGTLLAAVDNNGTNTTQVLAAMYERAMIGGNTQMKVTAGAGTNATVTATIYYERTRK